MRKALRIAKQAIFDIIDDDVLPYAAAIAFYTALSLPPLLVLLVWLLEAVGHGAEEFLRREATGLVGPEGATFVDSILDNFERRISLGNISGWIGFGALLFAASGVFAQLQAALNRIWQVEAKPVNGWWLWVRKRGLSIGLIGVVAFLMATSLAATTLLNATGWFEGDGTLVSSLHLAATLLLFTLLFTAVFKLLPDVTMRWRDVIGGAAVTAVLFTVAKHVIGLYIAEKGIRSAYGAAGSAIVVLVWVYFSGAVLLVGAEITKAWIRARGRRIEPNEFAVRTDAAA